MDSEKNDGEMAGGKHLIPMTTKFTTDEYIYVGEAAKRVQLTNSNFLRNAALIEADRVNKKPAEIKNETPLETNSEIEVLKFQVEAMAKYFAAKNWVMPTQEELIKLWIEGKREVAAFGRVKTIVMPAKLPEFLMAIKNPDSPK